MSASTVHTPLFGTCQSVQHMYHCHLGHASVIYSVQYTHHHNLGHTSVAVSTVHTPLQFGTHISTVHTPPQFGTHINPSSTYCDTPPQFGTLVIQDSTHTTTIWHTVSTIHMSPPFGKLIQYGLNMRISHLITKQHRYMLQLYTINPMTVWPTFSSTTDSYHLMTSSILKHAHNMLNSKILTEIVPPPPPPPP